MIGELTKLLTKSKHWRHSSNIECRVQKGSTKDQLFKKFRGKRKKIPDILTLNREKKKKGHRNGHPEMVNSLKRRFNAAINKVSDLLNENREIKEENVAVFIVSKENIEGQLLKYCKEFERFEETLDKNEENEKILVNYESVINEVSKLLNHLKGVIKGNQQMLEAIQRENQRKAKTEERENQRKGEAKEKENQRKAKLEREKLRIDEKLQLEKVSLERLIIEVDATPQKEKLESEVRLREAKTKKRDTNLKIDKFRHKVKELTAQNHSTVSKRTSVRLPRIELK